MKTKKRNYWNNIIWIILILVLLVPQSRKQLQLGFHKVFSKVNWIVIAEGNERVVLQENTATFVDASGQILRFQDLKGKVVLINFWATWCPPCLAEMPSLQSLYSVYKDEVVFLFVTNDDFTTVQRFLEKHHYDFKVYRTPNGLKGELQTKSIPRTLILSKKSEIVVDKNGAVDWFDDDVQNLLNRLISERSI